jgi:hypothetical protein
MRALTLTQPWAGLVASGIKRIENRPRTMIKPEDFGEPFAIHASREIDLSVFALIYEIAPELRPELATTREATRWHQLARVTSAVIGIATIDKAFAGSWNAESIAEHASVLSFTNGELLGSAQVRWFFGPVGYALRDGAPLECPVPCKGALGFWTLPNDVSLRVEMQVALAREAATRAELAGRLGMR